MRGRLFWKILLGFWLTFIIMTQALWVAFAFYGNRYESTENRVTRHLVNLQLNSAAAALRKSGMPALNAMVAGWPQDDRRFFSVALSAEPPAEALSSNAETKAKPAKIETWIMGADNQGYLLSYDIEGLRQAYRPERRWRILNIPQPMLWAGGVCGLMFSAVLAWNLTRPMRQLSGAFERVAQGDLAVRLFPKMRKRHDELSDLARDFDRMAERLELLVSAREQLLHDVSHELRSPLARMQLAIGLGRQNPDNVENSLQRLEHEAGRLDKMIGELLTLSRVESNSLPDEEYFDLYGLVEVW